MSIQVAVASNGVIIMCGGTEFLGSHDTVNVVANQRTPMAAARDLRREFEPVITPERCWCALERCVEAEKMQPTRRASDIRNHQFSGDISVETINIFEHTGQGFTGLLYAYHPSSGSEVQVSRQIK